MMTLEAQAGGYLQFSPEQVFKRYELEIRAIVINFDLIEFMLQDTQMLAADLDI